MRTPCACAGWSPTRAPVVTSTATERLTNELLDASNGLGASVKKRGDTHKMAEKPTKPSRYRW